MKKIIGIALEPKDSKIVETQLRQNEDSGAYFRSGRFFKVNDAHYFSTREGTEIGPYDSMESAAQGLAIYIVSITKDENVALAKKLALSGNWAVTMYQ